MKKTVILIALSIVFQASKADSFEDAMQFNIEKLYAAKTETEYTEVINAFSRIAQVASDRWEPLYYVSFGYAMQSQFAQQADQKDKLLDLSQDALDKATKLNPGEAELAVMQGFVHTMRLSVDPASRGQEFSGKAVGSFQKALTIDPENPRALMMMGEMLYGISQFMNTPTDEACRYISQSIESFDSYTSDNPFAPTWGKEGALQSKNAKCK